MKAPVTTARAPALRAQLWRAIAVFRFASLGYAAVLLVVNRQEYHRPVLAWAIVAAMTAWTVVTTLAYASPRGRGRWLLTADVVLTGAALLSTALVQAPGSVAQGSPPLTATWVAGPVLAWAVASGGRAGVLAAIVLGACDLTLRNQSLLHAYRSPVLNGSVLLLLAAVVVGYFSALLTRAELALRQATEHEAASRERERIARGVHDSVLQALALIQRRGVAAGGEAAEIGRLAGEQEIALRALVAVGGQPVPGAEEADLTALLSGSASPQVSVIAPAGPVLLEARKAAELAAAVGSALDNVRHHAGDSAKAWVLIDDEGPRVSVTVRDDGPGIPDGRLEAARGEHRLGISQSIQGRMRELGGSASITSAPGTGTEVRLVLPRQPAPGAVTAPAAPAAPRQPGEASA